MSIALSIQPKSKGPEAAQTVPVATMSAFDLYWAPAAAALELRWVPLFRTGVPVHSEDIVDIVQELTMLRQQMKASDPEVASLVLPRIERLISALNSAGGDPDVDIYIG